MKKVFEIERVYTKEEEERGYKTHNFFEIMEYQNDKLLLTTVTIVEGGNISNTIFVMNKEQELELLKVLTERNKK